MLLVGDDLGGDQRTADVLVAVLARTSVVEVWSRCLGRTLDPVETAALLLREVFELKNREAARALGLSESVFRHHLAAARATMRTAFRDLCALVGKQGVCRQCDSLRDECPPHRRGPEVVTLRTRSDEDSLARRTAQIRVVEFGAGPGWPIHEFLLRYMSEMFG